MTRNDSATTGSDAQPRRFGIILFLFLFSGISGLIYETVWLRVLIRVMGSTVYATSVVLAAFMAGLALGSYLFGRLAGRRADLLRIYALLELGVGLSALSLLAAFGALLPVYRLCYGLAGGGGFWLTLCQSGLMFALLLVPTSLMGGTLPVLAAYTQRAGADPSERLGALYGLNTLGAVAGVLFSGLFAIGQLGERATVFAGAATNLAVALAAFLLLTLDRGPQAPAKTPPPAAAAAEYPVRTRRFVLWAYGLSGFAAIAYEIVWTRMFQIQVGTSIYAFSLMLACYLAGIAAGSVIGGRLTRSSGAPLQLFGLGLLFVACYSVLGLHLFTAFKPTPVVEALNMGTMVLVPLLIVFPVTLVLGAIFPLAFRCYRGDRERVGPDVGRFYAFNTAGCILGSLVCGFLLISLLGTKGTAITLAGLELALGWTALLIDPARKRYRVRAPAWGLLLAALALGVSAPDPFMAMVKKRMAQGNSPEMLPRVELYYHKEGVAATTTALGLRGIPAAKKLWVNGIGMTVLCDETKVMAHLPLLLHPDPRNILVICFGMGTTLRSAWAHRGLRCDAVELVPEVYDCFRFFHPDGPAILADPRVRHFAGDGRNFLLMRPQRYDVITMDPAPPLWSAGTVNLYTREFFQLCRDRLNPGGIMLAWVPGGEFSECRMIMKTFAAVFPNSWVYGTTGLYLIGYNGDQTPDYSRFKAAASDPAIMADLREFDDDLPSPERIPGQLVLDPRQLAAFVGKAREITDDRPYTEFPLWRRNDRSFRWRLDATHLAMWRDELYGAPRRADQKLRTPGP